MSLLQGLLCQLMAFEGAEGDCTSKISHPLHIRELNGAHDLDLHGVTHLFPMTLHYSLLSLSVLSGHAACACLACGIQNTSLHQMLPQDRSSSSHAGDTGSDNPKAHAVAPNRARLQASCPQF